MIGQIIDISLQQLIMSVGFMLDNFMVSRVGSLAIAALGSASRFIFIVRLAIIAFAIANAVLAAQFSDRENRSKFMVTSVVASLIFSALFIGVYFLNREYILLSFSSSLAVGKLAGRYIDIAIFSSFTLSISMSMITTLRNRRSRTPLIALALGLIANFVFSWLFMFNMNLGLEGAAWGTVASEALTILILLISVLKAFVWPSISMADGYKYMQIASPILFGNMAWAIYVMLMQNLFGRFGASNLAAYGVVIPIETIMYSLFNAYSFVAVMFVGEAIGQSKFEEAYRIGKQMLFWAFVLAVLATMGIITITPKVLGQYVISSSEKVLATKIMLILSLSILIRLPNSVIYDGILRAGGDMAFVTFWTIILSWVLILPPAYYGYHYLNWDILNIYMLMAFAEIVPFIADLYRFFSLKWINNLTKK